MVEQNEIHGDAPVTDMGHALEQNYLFVWDSCLRWFMGVNNENIVHSKSRLP